ncbi:MAG: hypothetical protein IJT87_05620 [Ruminiclostridium sp.]|nr:hypothetical protein [Ruminiclostridium sp.]
MGGKRFLEVPFIMFPTNLVGIALYAATNAFPTVPKIRISPAFGGGNANDKAGETKQEIL